MTDKFKTLVKILVQEALDEDDRQGDGSHFDRDGWGNFFHEDWKRQPFAVEAAWKLYQCINGGK